MVDAALHELLAGALRALDAGDVEEARKRFETVLNHDADEPTARNWLGADALTRQDSTAAITHFSRACASEPKERSHWINLAAAHRLAGDAMSEQAALDSALGLDQTDLLALIRLAELHEREGQMTPAAERWNAVSMLASQIANPSAEFVAVVRHARSFVTRQQSLLERRVDDSLAEDLLSASPRDQRRMRTAADAWLGRRQIYANQCEGLHYPFLPADEFFDRELFPWLERLEAATPEILGELQTILADPGEELTPYISLPPGVQRNKWSPLDGSLEWGAYHLWKEGERFDAACRRAPRTAELIESLPICWIEGRSPNVFFSILKAGGHIPAHTGVSNVRSVVHLPLIVPAGCQFRVGGEIRDWVKGEAFAFDDTIDHEAWNRSSEARAVLIIDAWNPHLSEHERRMICQLYGAADSARA